jgi:PKD repeat protein
VSSFISLARRRSVAGVVAIMAAITAAGCTLTDVSAPPLQGPSELGLALDLQADPDILSLDGASQARIIVQARDANGQPARNVTFRAETSFIEDNQIQIADCGALSARTLVTNGDGRATLIYTAPMFPCDATGEVTIRITPFGCPPDQSRGTCDSANQLARTVSIRLVPPGVIQSGGPRPAFTINGLPTLDENGLPANTNLNAFVDATFDASSSTPGAGSAIASYLWNFGDGTTTSGRIAVHRFAPGSYSVRLTVTNTNNQSAITTRTVTVDGAASAPTASFAFSPSTPGINQAIVFNASASTAGAGRTIVRYDWNFGSGAPQSGVTVTKSYDVAGTYNVVLTVTDDVGQTDTDTRTVPVSPTNTLLVADFTFSPTDPHSGIPVNFNGSSSRSTDPIVNYAWDFGDGTTSPTNAGPIPTPHPYTVTVTSTFVVRLTITDSVGRTATITKNVQVLFP